VSFSLDAPQRKQIERRRQNTRDYCLGMRLSALLWRDDGKTESEIAHWLGVCERRVRNWLRRYRKKGLGAPIGVMAPACCVHVPRSLQRTASRLARVGLIAEWPVDLRKPKGGSDIGQAGLS
jgi:predicted transcriptional regulator